MSGTPLLYPFGANVPVAATANIAYDSVGAGSDAGGGSMSWTQTSAAGAHAFSFVVNGNATDTITATYGGTSMTNVGYATDGFGSVILLFGLAGVSGGSQTVSISSNSGNMYCANSISYTGVTSVSAITTSTFTTSSWSWGLTCSANQVILQAFEDYNATAITSVGGGNDRWGPGSLAVNAMSISDATSNTTFTASLTTADDGAGISVVLS